MGRIVQSLYKPSSTLLNSKKFNIVDTNKGIYLILGKIITFIGLKEGLLKYSQIGVGRGSSLNKEQIIKGVNKGSSKGFNRGVKASSIVSSIIPAYIYLSAVVWGIILS